MTTLVAVGDSAYPTPSELRDILLRTIIFGFNTAGLEANVLPGSDIYIRTTAVAGPASIAIANSKLARADINPLTAQGDALVTLAAVYGVKPRPASPSSGGGIVKCTGTVTVTQGYKCTGPNGLKYQQLAVQTRTTGQEVTIISVDTGSATNLGAGIKLTWDSAAIGALNPLLIVDAGGLTGGADTDTPEQLRTRLITRLAFPAVGGNWSQVLEWAEEASAAVEAAYVYTVRGPASYDVAVTKAGGDRSLGVTTLNAIAAFINSKMPGSVDFNITSANQQQVDVVVGATLPLPQAAGGAGGGWRDAAPWPAEDTKCTAYNSTTITATVNSTASPIVGQNIGVWNAAAVDANGNPAPVMVEYIVATVGGGVGAWTITVQNGFTFSPLNAYVSAGAVHLVQYAAELLAQIGVVGPGEKTTNQDILPRGRRLPGGDVSGPMALTYTLLSKVTQAQHPEIIDLQYTNRYDTGTTNTRTSPDVPLTTADPPNILTLKYLAIRKL